MELTVIRDGHVDGDGATWVPLWGVGASAITALPAEGGSPPADPLAGAMTANLLLYLNPGIVVESVAQRVGGAGNGATFRATENAQAIATIPVSPGDAIPQVLVPSGMRLDFRLEVFA
ncbi:MAG: hypothetical protein AAGF75_06420 [Cyanobacteria bacterium P01_H01_bin.130]